MSMSDIHFLPFIHRASCKSRLQGMSDIDMSALMSCKIFLGRRQGSQQVAQPCPLLLHTEAAGEVARPGSIP
jgi:hypothetical protein